MGPSTLLFSILYQYYRIVPQVYTYRIFGVPLNNKSVLYFLALQVRRATRQNVSRPHLTS